MSRRLHSPTPAARRISGDHDHYCPDSNLCEHYEQAFKLAALLLSGGERYFVGERWGRKRRWIATATGLYVVIGGSLTVMLENASAADVAFDIVREGLAEVPAAKVSKAWRKLWRLRKRVPPPPQRRA